MKKVWSIILIAVLTVSTAACGSVAGDDSAGFVGLAMPTKSSERWVKDGENMAKEFEALGYKTDLQYAEDVVENQVAQIENMITKGVDVLVVAAIDGKALTDVLQLAKEQGVEVVAYDRLIMNSENVSYYVTFDNLKVGALQGKYIEKRLDLKKEKGPFNIELFAGSPDDNNAHFYFKGAMSVLQPYIDEGKLVVSSGQTDFNQIATLRWEGAKAQKRMDDVLSSHYTTEKLDAVLSPYDGISIGVISSLKGVGYNQDDMPIITGQDAEVASVKSIIAGNQTQTVFKDTRKLAKKAVDMVDAILKGEQPEVNDTKTYDNGVKVVPSYLLEPVSVDRSNYKEELIDSGYYKREDLK
ncbi:multiple monosaccharide ABC transporter substrate-binding protein [Paludifilum halophilum]|uniref:Sugar ABC transporter substrate-binding protein n=1 Tax=Paludifilum halophilum TaxID=1642702 RepID=A0A235B5H0_9BACL|nr:multiple monosaccharide ABC transporter substrate-binding protein [Paludifilum halophilum]OYD06845.1 sugar ABC transporter substrate-binding protein [Paludifilum halophilum]